MAKTGDGSGRAPDVGSREGVLAWLLVRLAAGVVPGGRRAEWLREWRGELWARALESRPLLGPALGAFPHAAVLRAEAVRHATLQHARDLRHAARALARRPLFTLPAVLTLALGLGATTAVYSVVDAVLLAPLPYPDAERWVGVRARVTDWDQDVTLSDELLQEWRDRARGFEQIEAYVTRQAQLAGAGTPMVAMQARITAHFLPGLLGVDPLAGRLFDPAEAAGDGPAVVLLSERLWRERFEARPDVAGTVLKIDGEPVQVVGVVPTVHLLPLVDVWTPYRLRADHSRTVLGSLVAIGRLSPGWTRERAEAALRDVHAVAAADHPASLRPFEPVLTDHRARLVGDVRTQLFLLLGAVAAVLLIACVNVTNLLLARGIERAPEMAVRASLGAGRGHLVSQALAESLIVAFLGGLAAAFIAWATLGTLLARLPSEMPLASAVRLDLRVLGFATAATLGTALLVGLLPMVRASRATAAPVSRASTGRGQRRASAMLLGLEVAQAGALLAAAGLMLNTLLRMTTAPSGFDPAGLVFVHLDLPGRAFAAPADPARRARFMEELRTAARGIEGVRSVGIGTATPFSGITFITRVEPEGGVLATRGDGGIAVPADPDHLHFSRLHVDAGYLPALGLPIVAGRGFEPRDFDGGERVAIVNETAARAYWPEGGPLGRRVRERDGEWTTIVGVTADFGHPGLPTRGMAELYLPLTPGLLAGAAFARPTALVRLHPGAAEPAAVERVRRAIWSLDPDLAIPAIATAREELGASLAEPRFYALLLGCFAALALALASVGVYGVVAHSVARRTREIGIRMALGAPAASISRMVVGETLRTVAAGVVLGLAAGAAASRLLEGMLFGIEPTDPPTFAAVAAVLVGIAAAAAWLPARRAMRADPVRSLRAD